MRYATRGLCTALTVLLAVAGVLALVLLAWFPSAVELTYDPYGAVGNGWALVGLANFATTVATFVIAIIWSHRVVANTALLVHGGAGSPGLAVGAWFIPMAGIVVIGTLLVRADRAVDRWRAGVGLSPRRRATTWVVAWTACYSAVWMITFSTWFVSWWTVPDLAMLRSLDTAQDVTQTATAVAAPLAIAMVQQVSARQSAALDVAARRFLPRSAPLAAGPAPGAPVPSWSYGPLVLPVSPPAQAPPPAAGWPEGLPPSTWTEQPPPHR